VAYVRFLCDPGNLAGRRTVAIDSHGRARDGFAARARPFKKLADQARPSVRGAPTRVAVARNRLAVRLCRRGSKVGGVACRGKGSHGCECRYRTVRAAGNPHVSRSRSTSTLDGF
jgi:hypothetical protein